MCFNSPYRIMCQYTISTLSLFKERNTYVVQLGVSMTQCRLILQIRIPVTCSCTFLFSLDREVPHTPILNLLKTSPDFTLPTKQLLKSHFNTLSFYFFDKRTIKSRRHPRNLTNRKGDLKS